MSTNSGIQWTSATWNPVVGCTRASAGCDHCYAVTMTKRLAAMGQAKYQGLVGKGHFNGVVRCVEEDLAIPLHWRKPRRIFVNSMSDLFHKDVPFDFIDKVFAVMAVADQHTYQVLTKRPERMAEYFDRGTLPIERAARPVFTQYGCEPSPSRFDPIGKLMHGEGLEHIWLGTSAEDQAAADERIPHLLRCPAAVRFLSCEPLLGPIDLTRIEEPDCTTDALGGVYWTDHIAGEDIPNGTTGDRIIRWCILGGESGHGARPCNVEWIRSIVQQCQAAGVPAFVKQLGALAEDPKLTGQPTPAGDSGWPAGTRFSAVRDRDGYLVPSAAKLRDPKGGDPSEWPEDLRVRQFPEVIHAE